MIKLVMSCRGQKPHPSRPHERTDDPADRLIVEDYPSLQDGFKGGITVHATSATTAGIQAAKRAAQQAQPSAADQDKGSTAG